MNWLGELVQKHVVSSDTVLDLGCGIFQATSASLNKSRGLFKRPDSLACKSLIGVEVVDAYIERAKQFWPVIKLDISKSESLSIFPDRSFDVVMALDVVEHLELETALDLIARMKEIARKKVIVYTPKEFETNEQHARNVWGIEGTFETQMHRSLIKPETFMRMGFAVTFPEPDRNTLAIYEV